jgi:hypothetical protein
MRHPQQQARARERTSVDLRAAALALAAHVQVAKRRRVRARCDDVGALGRVGDVVAATAAVHAHNGLVAIDLAQAKLGVVSEGEGAG